MSYSVPVTNARRALLLSFAFFLSGAAGLIFEIAWLKALGLIFGNTVDAVTGVLAAYMGGLGLGSWYLGRRLQDHPRPVAMYCYLELGVAGTALLTFAFIPLMRILYYATGGLPVVGVLCAMLLLLAPTFLMGGTLPVLVRFFREGQAETGASVSRLYAVNTAGAVAGTLTASFVLLGQFGIIRTALWAAGFNVAAAMLALWGDWDAPDSVAKEEAAAAEAGGPPVDRTLAWVAAISGATAMILEIAWTRLLAAPLGGSVYGFSVILAAFLIGLAGGSRAFTWLTRRRAPDRGTLAILQWAVALAGLLALALWRGVPLLVWELLRFVGPRFSGLTLVQFVGALIILLLPALFYGLSFPWLAALWAPAEQGAGRGIGRLYGVNTAGAIAGSLLAGLLLVPYVGCYGALAVATAASVVAGVLLQRSKLSLAVVAGFLLLGGITARAGLFSHSALDQESLVADFYPDRFDLVKLTLREITDARDHVFIEDGKNTTVAVFRQENQIALKVNGKVDASMLDMRTQVVLGAVPLAMHPAPRRVLVIGFGSGTTTRLAALWPGVEHVDVVEIEPAVLRAAPLLKSLNHEVYRNKAVRVILDDARHFLFTTSERYDVVISEPSNPWMAGVGNLYTSEFYREAAARLGEGGIFGQWVQGYHFLPEDLALVARTLFSAYPQVSLWRAGTGDFLLVGSRNTVWPDSPQSKAAFEKSAELRTILWQYAGMDHIAGLWAYLRLEPDDLRNMAGWGPVNSDDRPLLEYRAGSRLAWLPNNLIERVVASARRRVFPVSLSADDRLAMAETLWRIGDPDNSRNVATALFQEIPDSADLWLYAGDWSRVQNQRSSLEPSYIRALEKGGGARAMAGLALAAAEAGRGDAEDRLRRTIEAYGKEAAQGPAGESSRVECMIVLARLLATSNRLDEAIEWQKKVIAAAAVQQNPYSYVHWAQLGAFYKNKGDWAAVREAAGKSLELEPYGAVAHGLLGEMYLNSGRYLEAVAEYRLVLRFHPGRDRVAYERAAEAFRRAGEESEAERILARAAELFTPPAQAAPQPNPPNPEK